MTGLVTANYDTSSSINQKFDPNLPLPFSQRPRAKYMFLGDSQVGLSNGPVAITSYTYNSTSGLVTVTLAGHGLINGTFIGFQVRNAPAWNTYETPITVISTSVFSFFAAPGLTTFTTSDARYFKCGTCTGQGLGSWIQAKTKGKLRLVRNAGVTGETSDQIFNRLVTEAFSVLSPGDTIILNFGHNDITFSGTAASIYANAIKLVSACVAYGLNVVVINISPYGATYSVNTVANRAIIVNANRLLNNLPLLYPRTAVIDIFSKAVDGTLTTLSGTSGSGTAKSGWIAASDNLHWTPLLTESASTDIAAVFDKWYPDAQLLMTCGFDSYDLTNNAGSSNLMQNAGLTTATGGSVGSMAGAMGSQWTANCSLSAGAMTDCGMTASVQQASWSGYTGKSAKIAWSDSPTVAPTFSNSTLRFFSGASQHARFNPGDYVIVRGRFKSVGLATFIDYFLSQFYVTVDGANLTVSSGFSWIINGTASYPQSEFDSYFESGILRLPLGISLTNLQWEMGVVPSGTTSGACDIELGQITMQKLVAL